MDSTPSTGTFMIDANGRSFWSASGGPGGPMPVDNGSGPAAPGVHSVEKYTGVLGRDDDVPVKPVAAMSYGGRVRIAKLFKSHEDLLDQKIKVAGWAKSVRA